MILLDLMPLALAGATWGLVVFAVRTRREAERVAAAAEVGASQVRQAMLRDHGAASRAGRMAVLPEGATYKAVAAPVSTINEARRAIGLPDVEWGDVLETPPPGTPVAVIALAPRPVRLHPKSEAELMDAISTEYATNPGYTIEDVEHDAERVLLGKNPDRLPERGMGTSGELR